MKRLIAMMLLAVMMLSLIGCGKEDAAPAANVDLQSVYTSMEGTLPAMLPMDETMMLNFCGIKSEQYTQAVVAVCDDGLRADEIWLIEAKDAAALAELKALAEGRLTRKGEESITYSPEQYKVVEKAQVITAGNYLAVIVSPDVEQLTDIFNQAVK